jgi:hypothetical protein
VRRNPDNLQHAPAWYRNDECAVLRAMKRWDLRGNMGFGDYSWYVIKHASAALCNCPTFMEKAVEVSGEALQFAGPVPRDNSTVVLAAVRQDYSCLRHASKRLKRNRKFLKKVMKVCGGRIFQFGILPEDVQSDSSLVIHGLRKNGMLLQYMHPTIQNDRRCVLAAVNETGFALRIVLHKYRTDLDVVVAAVTETKQALKFVPGDLRQHPRVLAALRTHE